MRFENLDVSENAKLKHNGKDIKLTDLKPGTGVLLELEAASEFGLMVIGIETLGKAKPGGDNKPGPNHSEKSGGPDNPPPMPGGDSKPGPNRGKPGALGTAGDDKPGPNSGKAGVLGTAGDDKPGPNSGKAGALGTGDDEPGPD